MKNAIMLAPLILAIAASCSKPVSDQAISQAAAERNRDKSSSSPTQFVVGSYRGTSPRFLTKDKTWPGWKKIKEAGFNLVGPLVWHPTQPTVDDIQIWERILNDCADADLKVVVTNNILQQRPTQWPTYEQDLGEFVESLRPYQSLGYYAVWDEPKKPDFKAVQKYFSAFQELDSAHPAFVNLNPDRGHPTEPSTYGFSSYREYVAEFIRQNRPQVVSFDHYSLFKATEEWWNRTNREQFFNNLQTVGDLARDGLVTPWVVYQLKGWGPQRLPTKQDLGWQAYTSIAFGMKGVLYFHLSDSSPREPGGILDQKTGEPIEPRFSMVKGLNHEIFAVGQFFFNMDYLDSYFQSDRSLEEIPAPSGLKIDFTGSKEILVGHFAQNDKEFFLLTPGMPQPAIAKLKSHQDIYEVNPHDGSKTLLLDRQIQIAPGTYKILEMSELE